MTAPVMAQSHFVATLLAISLPWGGCIGSYEQGPNPRGNLQRRHGSPMYRAASVIEAHPRASSSAAGWDEQRLWSRFVDWEPAIAADREASHVYQVTTRYYAPPCAGCADPAIVFRRSTDGGNTWEADQALETTGGNQFDPQIEVAADGTLFAVYQQGFTPGVMLIKSVDNGITWSSPVALLGAGPPGWSDKPWLVVSPDGKDIYVGFNAGDSYVVSSHDSGATFSEPMRTSYRRYWFHSGGAVAPDGTVYIATTDFNRHSYRGNGHINVIRSTDGGTNWVTTRVDTSKQPPRCKWANGCYFGFLGSQVALAVDPGGTLMIAYNAGTSRRAPQQMWVRTSVNGITWSARTRMSVADNAVNNAFPALAAGPMPGDFRLVWQSDTEKPTARWNTWYRRTADSGANWSGLVRLSDRSDGAAYKGKKGFRFPYGDYLEIAVDGNGVNHVIWGEGQSYSGNGGTWYTRGGW